MEAALTDYSNSFNCLQSASEVQHEIIVPSLPFGEEGEEGGRRVGPESHVPSSTLQLTGLHTGSVGGVVDSDSNTPLGVLSLCHADYLLVFIHLSSEHRQTLQVLLLFLLLRLLVISR